MTIHITSREDRKIRLAICAKCIHSTETLGMKVCGACRCPLSSKSILAQSTCPHGYWPLIN